MDSLWQKESNDAGALFVDIFKDVKDTEISALAEMFRSLNVVDHKKDDSLAKNYRIQGNAEFQRQNWIDAMRLYNKSLCFSEIGSENVSLAYANRSACFLRLKMYNECLVDIELAKQANYPEHLLAKLDKRHAESLKLKNEASHCDPKKPKISYKAHQNFPEMANVLKVVCNEEYGRHVVAKCDIEVGKTVLVERSFISKKRDGEFNACTICLKTMANLIACSKCRSAMFCSSDCISRDSIHKLECGYRMDTKTDSEYFARFVSFGLHTFPSTESWMKFVEDAVKVKSKTTPAELKDEISKYRAILQLNIVDSPQNWKEAIEQAQNVYRYLMIRRSINDQMDTEEKKRFLMHYCMHFCLILLCNRFGNIDTPQASTVYIILSYFNHSCAPNIHLLEGENHAIGITIRPIKKGQQLFVTYTADFSGEKSSTFYQRYLFEKFGFRCNCERCKEGTNMLTSQFFQTDDEYHYLAKEMTNRAVGTIDEKTFFKLQKKCANLLQRYGNMSWCVEMETVMHVYVLAINSLVKKGLFE